MKKTLKSLLLFVATVAVCSFCGERTAFSQPGGGGGGRGGGMQMGGPGGMQMQGGRGGGMQMGGPGGMQMQGGRGNMQMGGPGGMQMQGGRGNMQMGGPGGMQMGGPGGMMPGGAMTGAAGPMPPEIADRTIGMLRALDTNGDGQLNIKEIPEYRRAFVTGMLQRFGVDLEKKAIKLADLEKLLREGAGGDNAPLIPEFGEEDMDSFDPILGFGQREPVETTAATNQNQRNRQQNAQASSPQDLAKQLLAKNDRNSSGMLEQDNREWNGLPFDAKLADLNGDGRLALSEIVIALGGSASSYANTSYTFIHDYARLPEGVPAWFLAGDADKDGQLSMEEYATVPAWRGRSWSDTIVEEFEFLDLNGDGLVTTDELFYVLQKDDEEKAKIAAEALRLASSPENRYAAIANSAQGGPQQGGRDQRNGPQQQPGGRGNTQQMPGGRDGGGPGGGMQGGSGGGRESGGPGGRESWGNNNSQQPSFGRGQQYQQASPQAQVSPPPQYTQANPQFAEINTQDANTGVVVVQTVEGGNGTAVSATYSYSDDVPGQQPAPVIATEGQAVGGFTPGGGGTTNSNNYRQQPQWGGNTGGNNNEQRPGGTNMRRGGR